MKHTRNYYKFSDYLKEHFNCRVYKVTVDAGFSCPNRDGKKSTSGCIYCDNRGFNFSSRATRRPLNEQIKHGIASAREVLRADKFIIYFQAYTNTYAQVKVLKEHYDIIRNFEDVVGLAIGTRPDCVNEESLDLIASYTGDYDVWLEYGLQSIHNKSLKAINRGHSYEDFLEAIKKTKARPKIKICAHVIIGLPNETKEDIIATAKELGRIKIESVKIHPLHIIKGTKLEELFAQGEYYPLTENEYVDLTAQFLEYLHPQTVIQRIIADCPREFLVEPLWMMKRGTVLKNLDNHMRENGKFQGRLYNA